MREVGALVAVVLVVVSGFAPFVVVAGVASAAGNTTIVVAADGTGDHRTIQAGVDAATAGDTVEVRPGTYTEQVTVDTDITLVAPNGATLDGTKITGDAVGLTVDPSLTAGLTIDGFTLTGYTDGVTVGASAGESYDDDGETGITGGWTIRDLVSTDNAEDGLDIGAATGTGWTLRNVEATANGDDGIEIGGFASGTVAWRLLESNASANDGYGIRVSSTSGSWELLESTTSDNRNTGLYASGTSGAWIIGHHNASANSFNGIDVAGGNGGDWTIHNTTASDNSDFGIGNGGGMAGNWNVRDSEVSRNFDYGLYAPNAPDDFRVRNLTARNNSKVGVVTSGTAGNWRIEDSTIEDNGGTSTTLAQVGIYAQDTTGAWVVNGSAITGNTEAGIDATNADVTGDATENWWGQSSGPASGQCVGNVDCTAPLTSDPGAPTTAGVQGTLTDTSANPLSGIDVTVYRDDGSSFVQAATGTTKSDGTYSVDGLDASGGSADLKLEFAAGSASYQSEWYDDAGSKATAKTVTVSAGAIESTLDAQLAETPPAVVRGTVTNASGDALSGVEVVVYRDDGAGTFSAYDTVTTDAIGDYSAEVLPPAGESSATVEIQFSDPNSDYRTEWYENTTARGSATRLSVASGGTETADGVLEQRYGYVGGTVRDADGNALSGIEVSVFRDDGNGQFAQYGTATTDSSGDFDVAVEPSAAADDTVAVQVRFGDPSGDYETAWHDDADRDGATTVTLTRGVRTTLLGTALTEASSGGSGGGPSGGSSSDSEPDPVTFSGRVTDENGDPIEGITVSGFRDGGNGAFVGVASDDTDANGRYEVAVEPPDGEDSVTARLRFTDWNWTYAQRWYDARTEDRAETLTVREGRSRIGLDTTMAENTVTVAGTVRSVDGDALEDIRVWVYRRLDNGRYKALGQSVTYTDGSGRYDTTVAVPDGETSVDLRVRFDDPDDEYATVYWRNASTLRDAESIDALAGWDLPNVRVTMPEWDAVAAGYGGTVLNETSALEGIQVTVYRDDGTGTFREWTNRRTDANGYWETHVRPPNGEQTVSVKIRYRDETGQYLEEWEFNESTRSTAEVTTVALGDFVPLYGTRLEPAPTARVSGVVFNESHDGLEDIDVTLYRKDGPGPSTEFATTTTDDVGYYTFDVPAPLGESTVETRLRFDDPTGEYAQAWYLDRRRWANATAMRNAVGSHDRHNFQTLREAGMLLDVWVQPLSTCRDPTDADSCTFPDREDTVTVDPDETVAVHYELWNGDDRVYRDYDVDDPATRTTMFGAGHEIAPGELRSKTETLTAPIVDGTYDYRANSTSDTRNGVVHNSTATYTIEVSGSVAQQARSPDGFSARISNSGSGEPVLLGGDDGVASTNGTTMQSVLLRTDDSNYTVNVAGNGSPPDGTDPLPLAPGGTAFGYFTVDHSVPDTAIENVTFRFRVDRADSSSSGVQPTDVTVYRYVDGVPTPLPTTVVKATSTAYVYDVASPGLSVFAVGTADLSDPPTVERATPSPDSTTAATTDTPVGTTGASGPGFTANFATLALLLTAFLLSRRR
ncbi:right-handed parallel beta-helix repeat-containing protein [Halorientalis pallida]|uniref:PGF-pre-PGF domain-containing protein n=1 Tax=Halorientalis pallida TaxID=2479928 RepID=A0A498L092_9EURY|nr:right-handed parallel beta-helix repeat-containing protein [Halorientalis pallida]RXK51698.1 PGF-pre-PGF domain-containing protein [Halorientalis pallida]